MNYANFHFDNPDYLIVHIRTAYHKSDCSRHWNRNPDDDKREIIDAQRYTNWVTSIPFFNNFGYKASCRAKKEYVCAGYLPTQITSINPDATVRYVDTFHFTSFPYTEAYKAAGFRERDVLDNLMDFKVVKDGDHLLINLLHRDCEHSATYDITYKRWVG